MDRKIAEFLDNSVTAFGAVKSIKEELINNGYKELDGKIIKGGKYFVTRNDSSIIAFNVGNTFNNPGLMIAASHTDCPSFKLKPNPIIKTDLGVKLNVEGYGDFLTRAWFDRPLSLAGRVMVKTEDGIKSINYCDDKPFCIIPSMAPHLARELEDKKVDLAVDMLPIVSLNKEYDFKAFLGFKLSVKKEDILGFDLYLYPVLKTYYWGENDEFITSHHIDNLECAYTTLMGFIDNFNDENINIYASFDNEEVGSLTRQGADSDFLYLTINRICDDLGLNYSELVKNGMLLSCDNAHGIHPNHPELYDKNNSCELNKGVVIKYNANQSYTSDSLSSSLLIDLMKKNNIDYQVYANKTGIRGGSTLGNLNNRHVSIMSIDIGLAQWAMHSAIETAGSKDIETMIKLVKCFYNSKLIINNNTYSLK